MSLRLNVSLSRRIVGSRRSRSSFQLNLELQELKVIVLEKFSFSPDFTVQLLQAAIGIIF